jgi:hypothetical protein
MAERQLGRATPDGTNMGQSATDKIGFYGTTAVVQATIAAAGTDAATTQALANDLRTKLAALGLVAT